MILFLVQIPLDGGRKKWKEGELARVEEEAIVIRDPIQFEFNTANILRPSIPTLQFVEKLMNQNL